MYSNYNICLNMKIEDRHWVQTHLRVNLMLKIDDDEWQE